MTGGWSKSGKDEYGVEGLRMLREETNSYKEFGVLCCGKRFRYSKEEIVDGKEE
jgi:hypothetical protein